MALDQVGRDGHQPAQLRAHSRHEPVGRASKDLLGGGGGEERLGVSSEGMQRPAACVQCGDAVGGRRLEGGTGRQRPGWASQAKGWGCATRSSWLPEPDVCSSRLPGQRGKQQQQAAGGGHLPTLRERRSMRSVCWYGTRGAWSIGALTIACTADSISGGGSGGHGSRCERSSSGTINSSTIRSSLDVAEAGQPHPTEAQPVPRVLLATACRAVYRLQTANPAIPGALSVPSASPTPPTCASSIQESAHNLAKPGPPGWPPP